MGSLNTTNYLHLKIIKSLQNSKNWSQSQNFLSRSMSPKLILTWKDYKKFWLNEIRNTVISNSYLKHGHVKCVLLISKRKQITMLSVGFPTTILYKQYVHFTISIIFNFKDKAKNYFKDWLYLKNQKNNVLILNNPGTCKKLESISPTQVVFKF